MRFATAAALGMLLLSMGCGEDGTGDSSEMMADCADVWVEGAQLPENYEGCTEGSLVIVPDLLECNDHGGQWTTYKDGLAAVLGDQIVTLPSVPGTEPGDTVHLLSC